MGLELTGRPIYDQIELGDLLEQSNLIFAFQKTAADIRASPCQSIPFTPAQDAGGAGMRILDKGRG